MARSHVEVERVFSPGRDAPLPELTGGGRVVRLEPAGETALDATYYDTPGLALLGAGVTLRRREGGPDEGWHLKLPTGSDEERLELHEPLGEGPERPPDGLLDLVDGWTRGIEVAAVARIRTTRTTWRLVGPDGRVLAELADDVVEGRPAQLDSEPKHWREWEVELVDGDRELLDALETDLASADVRPSRVTRKIALVLGPEPAPLVAPPVPRKKDPVRLALHRWLVTQVLEIAALDPVVRRGEPGGIHGLRKACRRLRAALGTYRPLLEREQTDPVREELRWLARSLGRARDDEVVLARITEQLAAEGDGPARATRQVLDEYATGRAAADQYEVAETLRSPRYHALRTSLDRLVAEPPWTDRAEEPARDVVPALLDKEWRRTKRRRRNATDPHEVRKATKRLRYAYELVEPVWGKRAARAQAAAHDVTELLGERQDSLVARAWLIDLAAAAERTGAPSFTFGRLHALEQQREQAALEQAARAWSDLERAVGQGP